MKKENFFVDGIEYSPGKVFVIAELGTSHGADPVKAGELIDAAAEAGADCIKFQIVYAHEILHPNTGEVALPGGKVSLYQRFKDLEVPFSFYAEMKDKVEKKGLVFLCTPFGPQSLRELRSLDPTCVKIASPELNYTALLREAASYGLPLFLSTGVSRLGDIEEALGEIQGNTLEEKGLLSKKKGEICLLHCVTAYPAPEKDYNLRVLNGLSSVFGCAVGVSDHSLDPILVPALAVTQGAAAIEKHFCLSRSDPGLDDPIALPPDLFKRMTGAIRQAEEAGSEQTLDLFCQEYGTDLIEAILGDGVKTLAPSERENYEGTKRSIHALRDIGEGEMITKDIIACLRTEKNLRPGLSPSWEDRIIGRRAGRLIPAGEGVRLEDI